MSVVTTTEVFNFMGTEASIVTNQTTKLQEIIDNVVSQFEQTTNRKLIDTEFTEVLFEDGQNCEIARQYLFLQGQFRDIYTITTLEEDNTPLVAVADSDDGNDFYLDQRRGLIKRVNSEWSGLPNAIKITGRLGLVNVGAPADTIEDIKQIITEMAAAKSGFWTINTETDGGDVTTIRTTISKDAKMSMKKYILRDF